MNYEPIFLEPVFKDYIWGGTKLKSVLNKNVVNEECTAESWEISTYKDSESVIKNGEFKGKTLRELFDNENIKKDFFGIKCVNLKEFPLLIKFIDANNRLSVQVHPDNEYAMKNENSQGKTEMWYILDCEEGSKIVYGLKKGISRDKLIEYINSNKLEEVLNYIDVKKDDVVYIPSGTVHTLLGKTLVLEVQQNSNITYRLYDWGRLGKDGKPRELHVNKALDVINYDIEPNIVNVKNEIEKVSIVNSEYFNSNKINVKGYYNDYVLGESFIAFNAINGEGELNIADSKFNIVKGDSFIIPANVKEYKIKGNIELVQTYI